MSRKPLLALAAATAVALFLVAGCEYVKAPPAQLAASITLEAEAGAQSDKLQLRKMADNIVGYLSIEGIDSKNTRVSFDETTKAYQFEVFGHQPIPKVLLDQVAKGLNPLEKDRSWPAKVEVAALPHLDTLLGGKERSFTVRAGWKDATVDTYVIRTPNLGFIMPSANPASRQPKTALCMLSFKPEPALPKLEGTVEQFYGKAEENDPHETLRRHARPDHVFTAAHEITFDEPELAKAFKEAPMAKDGKLMFQFAMLKDVNVVEFIGDDSAPLDFGGATQQKCKAELDEKYPALAMIMFRAGMLEHVKAFGPARMIALPVKAK